MALKMEVICSRCGKTDLRTVDSVAEGQAFELREKAKKARLEEILKFIKDIPVEELPDLMILGGGDGGVVHLNLCDPQGEESKRSCKKRVEELVKQASSLEPRKPRAAKKTADDAKPATE